jgi:uncharacterized protein DUF4157
MPVDHLNSREWAELGDLAGALDCSRVRLYRAGAGGVAGLLRDLVLWLSRNRAIALGNHVFLPQAREHDLPVLAHELTHCAQYQAWGPLVYFGKGIVAQARELLHRKARIGSSPYAYTPDPGKPFAAYGMEQQGQIVEDYFRGLTPFRRLGPSADGPQPQASCLPRAPACFHRGQRSSP